jgi:hypothetical protein
VCVIYACESALPSDKELEQGALCNADGAGIAWLKGGKVHWLKGLESDPKVIAETLKEQKIDFPFALHFRAASIGGIDPELTHPFPLSPEVETWLAGSHSHVLFHNGTWSMWDNTLRDMILYNEGMTLPSGPWNDTRALAFIAAHKGIDILQFISKESRELIMHNNKTNPFTYFGKWYEHKGWSQSIDTDLQWNRKWTSHNGRDDWEWDKRGYWRSNKAAAEKEEAKSEEGKATETASSEEQKDSSIEYPTCSDGNVDLPPTSTETWTNESLVGLLVSLEEELKDARKNSQIYS